MHTVAMVVAMDTLPLSQIVQVKGVFPLCVLMCSWTLLIWLWLLWVPTFAMVVAMDTYFCHGGCYGYLLLLWMPVIAIVVATNTYYCYGSLSQIMQMKGTPMWELSS